MKTFLGPEKALQSLIMRNGYEIELLELFE
jgi:hypothetical protein